MTIASLSFFSALAAVGEFSWGDAAERMLMVLASAGLTGLITIYVLKAQVAGLKEQFAEMARTVRQQGSKIEAAGQERMACELRCSQAMRVQEKTFATRDEFALTLTETVIGNKQQMERLDEIAQSFRDSVGKAHKRIDDLLQRVTRVEERAGKGHADA